MQSLVINPGKEGRAWIAPVNSYEKHDADSAADNDDQEGTIVIKKGEGVYFVKYNIIFAKAGDVFFMPRAVPEGFAVDTDEVIPFSATVGAYGSVSLQ